MPTYQCANKGCGKPFEARAADRKRGWARFCSKRCKAVEQEKRTGQYAAHNNNERNYRGSGVDRKTYEHYQGEHGGTPQFNRRGEFDGFVMSQEDLSYGGYGDSDGDTPFGEGKW